MPWEALFAVVWFPLAAGAIVRIMWPFDRDARLVLQTAAALATRHGHPVIESTHLALALTADEKIASELEARGVDVSKLYDDLDATLPEDAEPLTMKNVRLGEDVERVLASASKRRVFATRARKLLVALLHDESLASAVLARHWSGGAHGARVDDDAGPYRGRRSEKLAWAVRIWNDDRTTMDFVVGALHDTIKMREAHAVHAMLVTHYAGSAIVHRCERDEAERLAKLVRDAARAQSFPLRVTEEEITDSRP